MEGNRTTKSKESRPKEMMPEKKKDLTNAALGGLKSWFEGKEEKSHEAIGKGKCLASIEDEVEIPDREVDGVTSLHVTLHFPISDCQHQMEPRENPMGCMR